VGFSAFHDDEGRSIGVRIHDGGFVRIKFRIDAAVDPVTGLTVKIAVNFNVLVQIERIVRIIPGDDIGGLDIIQKMVKSKFDPRRGCGKMTAARAALWSTHDGTVACAKSIPVKPAVIAAPLIKTLRSMNPPD